MGPNPAHRVVEPVSEKGHQGVGGSGGRPSPPWGTPGLPLHRPGISTRSLVSGPWSGLLLYRRSTLRVTPLSPFPDVPSFLGGLVCTSVALGP